MTTERLNYLLTGTETPAYTTEREKTIISECAKIITGIEQTHKDFLDVVTSNSDIPDKPGIVVSNGITSTEDPFKEKGQV